MVVRYYGGTYHILLLLGAFLIFYTLVLKPQNVAPRKAEDFFIDSDRGKCVE